MATAVPLDSSVRTVEDFEREGQALWEQGLRGEAFLEALAGGFDDAPRLVAPTVEDIDAALQQMP